MKKNKIYFKLTIALIALTFQLNAQTWQNITYSLNGLPANNITTLSPDKQGNIWISTADSGFTNLKSGKFRTWRDKDKLNFSCTENAIGSTGISRMVKDSLNNLYFTSGYYNKGLVKFDSIFHFIKCPYNFKVFPLAVDKMGNIWCRTDNGTFGGNGVVKYSPNGLWQNYTSANSGLYRDIVNDITVDAFGNVWFGYEGSGNLSRFNGSNWKLYMDYDNSTSSVYILKSDNTGDVYGYLASVLIHYKRNLDTLIRRGDDPASGSSPIGVDLNNKVWTTSEDYANINIKLFKNSSTTNWTTYNLTGLNLDVNSMYFENLNTVWLTGERIFNSGSTFLSNKGLVRYNGSTFNLYTKENAGLLNNQTNDVIKGRNLNQLIIAHNDGISILDTITKTSKVYYQFNSGLNSDNYADVFIDSKNNKWIPSSYGVQKLLSNNIDWVYYSNDSLKYFDNYYATNICEDKLGNIWLLNYNGVSMISGNIILNFEKTQISQNTSSLVKIAADKNGNVFVSYSDGEIVKYNGTIWSVFTKNNNSSSNLLITDSINNIWTDSYIFPYRVLTKYNGTTWTNYNSPISGTNPTNIFCDRYNRIWLCYRDSGVTCFDGQTWKTYNVSNSNIISNNITSIYVDSLGKVWFGTDKGISVLTPAPAIAPNVSTAAATNITTNAAQVSGTIVSNGGSSITAKGICWSITPNPTVNNNKSTETTTNLTYISSLTGLSAGTKYYARAYATNAIGTSYGNEINFTTNSLIPGCVNTVLWPNAAVTAPQSAGQTIEITPGNGELDCNYAGEYSRTEGWKDELKYTIYSTRATDFITITDDNNFVIKSGVQPLEFTNSGTGIKRIHVSLNSSCVTEDVCRDISIKLNSSTGLSYYSLINNLQLFPNPSNGKMFLKADFNKYDLIEINAMNILGDCYKIKYDFVENGLLELNIPENITGIITLEITINGKSTFEKVSIIK